MRRIRPLSPGLPNRRQRPQRTFTSYTRCLISPRTESLDLACLLVWSCAIPDGRISRMGGNSFQVACSPALQVLFGR